MRRDSKLLTACWPCTQLLQLHMQSALGRVYTSCVHVYCLQILLIRENQCQPHYWGKKTFDNLVTVTAVYRSHMRTCTLLAQLQQPNMPGNQPTLIYLQQQILFTKIMNPPHQRTVGAASRLTSPPPPHQTHPPLLQRRPGIVGTLTQGHSCWTLPL